MPYELIKSGRRRIIVQKGEPIFIDAASISRRKENQMKGNIKKLAVFVMIAAIVMFTAVAMVSADDKDFKAIHGEYGFSSGGNCVSTPIANWTGDFTVSDPTKVSGISYNSHGIVTFEKNGTGTVDLRVWTTPIPPAWAAGFVHVSFPFTYTINGDGEINVESVPNKFKQEILNPVTGAPTGLVFYRDHFSFTGWVSADHKTIVLASPAPEILTLLDGSLNPLQKVLCHESLTCVRLVE